MSHVAVNEIVPPGTAVSTLTSGGVYTVLLRDCTVAVTSSETLPYSVRSAGPVCSG